jgi:hypothetical protein
MRWLKDRLKFSLYLIVVVSIPVIFLAWWQRREEEGFCRLAMSEGYGPGDGWDYGV